MLVLGLLLVLAGGAVGIAVATHNTDAATITAFSQSYDMTVLGVFLVGAVVGIAVMTGFSLMVAGVLGRRDRHRVLSTRVDDVRTENEQLEEENARLRAAISNDDSDGTDPYPTETETRTGRHRVR
jgi:cell division protein FtsB